MVEWSHTLILWREYAPVAFDNDLNVAFMIFGCPSLVLHNQIGERNLDRHNAGKLWQVLKSKQISKCARCIDQKQFC